MPLSRRGGDVSRASNLSEGGGSDKPAINPLESPSLGGHGPSDASTGFMQLVPNNMPKPRLISSIDPDETVSGADSGGSVSPSKETPAPAPAGNRRWLYIGIFVGAAALSIFALTFAQHAGNQGNRFDFPTFIKARTRDLTAAPASAASPAPIVIELRNDMLRVSAFSLGHPRLAIINGKAVTEGDAVTLQAPKSSIGVTLRIVRIGDGSMDLSDGRKMFSARLTIPSPPKPKAP